jgi:hypothetical protein
MHRSALSFLLFSILGSGCSGKVLTEERAPDAGTAEDAPSTLPEDSVIEACMALEQVSCDRALECAPFWYPIWFPSADACMIEGRFQCEQLDGAPGIVEGVPSFLACADALRTLDCDAFRSGDPPPPACELRGVLPDQTRCASSYQCESGCCHFEEDDRCGACSPIKSGPYDCETNKDCPSGTACHLGMCRDTAALGESCTSGPCKENLACLYGICSPMLGEGAPCSPYEDGCDSWSGLYCHPISEVCVLLSIAKEGEPCGWVGPNDEQSHATVCDRSAECEELGLGWTCARIPAEGEPCSAAKERPCREPARCVEGACRIAYPLLCAEP